MPSFRDIDDFIPLTDEEVNNDLKIQVSATNSVTLGQIAKLAKANAKDILLEGYNVQSGSSVGQGILPTDTINQAFIRLMQILGAGWINQDSLLQVCGKKFSGRTLSMISTKDEDDQDANIAFDPGKQLVGIGWGMYDGDPSPILENRGFTFKAKPWALVESGNVKPNEIHSDPGTMTFSEEWNYYNEASAISIGQMPPSTLPNVMADIAEAFGQVSSIKYVYIPKDLPDATITDTLMVICQKLGPVGILTVQLVN